MNIEPPQLSDDVSVNVMNRNMFQFSVKASGSTPLDYHWFLDNTEINDNNMSTLQQTIQRQGLTSVRVSVSNEHQGSRMSDNLMVFVYVRVVGEDVYVFYMYTPSTYTMYIHYTYTSFTHLMLTHMFVSDTQLQADLLGKVYFYLMIEVSVAKLKVLYDSLHMCTTAQ